MLRSGAMRKRERSQFNENCFSELSNEFLFGYYSVASVEKLPRRQTMSFLCFIISCNFDDKATCWNKFYSIFNVHCSFAAIMQCENVKWRQRQARNEEKYSHVVRRSEVEAIICFILEYQLPTVCRTWDSEGLRRNQASKNRKLNSPTRLTIYSKASKFNKLVEFTI